MSLRENWVATNTQGGDFYFKMNWCRFHQFDYPTDFVFLTLLVWVLRTTSKGSSPGSVIWQKTTVTWYWCMMCLFDFLPAFSFMYNKTSYPTLRCASGGRAERPQMVYANDDTTLIHQVKFRRNRYPWAHHLWVVEWSSTWWPMHLWPGHTK